MVCENARARVHPLAIFPCTIGIFLQGIVLKLCLNDDAASAMGVNGHVFEVQLVLSAFVALLEVLLHDDNLRTLMMLLNSYQLRSRASPEPLVYAFLGHGNYPGGMK